MVKITVKEKNDEGVPVGTVLKVIGCGMFGSDLDFGVPDPKANFFQNEYDYLDCVDSKNNTWRYSPEDDDEVSVNLGYGG